MIQTVSIAYVGYGMVTVGLLMAMAAWWTLRDNLILINSELV